MKRIMSVGVLAAVAALAGCAQNVTPDQLNIALAQAATLIANGCKIVQPTVAGAATATGNAAVATGAAVNGVFCAANESAVNGAAAPLGASTTVVK